LPAYYEVFIGTLPDSKETKIYLFKTYPNGRSFNCSGNATLHSGKGLVFVEDRPSALRDKLISIDGSVDDTKKILQAFADEIYRIGISPTSPTVKVKATKRYERKPRRLTFSNKYYYRRQKLCSTTKKQPSAI